MKPGMKSGLDGDVGRQATGDVGGVKARVEGGKAAPVLHRQGEEVDVGEVIGGGKIWKDARVREVVLPELVSGSGQNSGEDRAGGLRRSRPGSA